MRRREVLFLVVFAVLGGSLNTKVAAQHVSEPADTSPHILQYIAVQENVRVEVLDWGGLGRPIVLLAGYGNTAHVFDDFAPKLTDAFHVYGITRRGFGASDAPASGYTIPRLSDDVLAVLDSLHLANPVLIGHSIAGDELSALGSRHPDRVSGLVYLDAAYDRSAIKDYPADKKLQMSASYGKSAKVWLEIKENTPPPDYPHIRTPVLAIFAASLPPSSGGIEDPTRRAEERRKLLQQHEALVRDFQNAMPAARVVDFPEGQHYVFQSNESDVLEEIRAFLSALK